MIQPNRKYCGLNSRLVYVLRKVLAAVAKFPAFIDAMEAAVTQVKIMDG